MMKNLDNLSLILTNAHLVTIFVVCVFSVHLLYTPNHTVHTICIFVFSFLSINLT